MVNNKHNRRLQAMLEDEHPVNKNSGVGSSKGDRTLGWRRRPLHPLGALKAGLTQEVRSKP